MYVCLSMSVCAPARVLCVCDHAYVVARTRECTCETHERDRPILF